MGIKGYKVFNPDWTCRGFQYEVGKTFKYEGNIEMCGQGFHFCRKLSSCFNYYDFNKNNKVAEVEAIGNVETQGDKSVTDEIVIVKELSWSEVLELANEGEDCTGNRNSGDCNSGNRNSGNRNSGNRNSGNRNSGNRNSGNRNSGNRNSGDCNSGDCNSGNRNSGNRNSGDWNSGNRNSGDWNSGDWNSGNRNSGDWNSGDWNSGNCNSGDWNSGDWNSGDFSTGFFNSESQKITMFNKECDLSRDEILSLKGINIINWKYENNWWIYSENMTDEEKEQHPEHETTGGFLKVIPFKDACKLMWSNLTEDEKQAVKELPNFDAEVFKKITGIEVEGE